MRIGDDVVFVFSGPGIDDLLEEDCDAAGVEVTELVAVVNENRRLFATNLQKGRMRGALEHEFTVNHRINFLSV